MAQPEHLRRPGRGGGPLDTAFGVAAGVLVVLAAIVTPASRRTPAQPGSSAPTGRAARDDDGQSARERIAGATADLSRGGPLGAVDRFQATHRPTAFAVGVIRKFQDDRGGKLAALVSYYGFFSVFPALLALTTVLGFLLQNHDSLRTSIQDSALSQFPVIGDELDVASGLSGNWLALAVGIAGAVWAGMGAIQAAQDAMNAVWDVPLSSGPSFVAKRVRSLLTLVLIATMFAANAVVPQLLRPLLPDVVGEAVLLGASAVVDACVFVVAFRLLTVAPVSWRDLVPGAIVAALGYVVLLRLGVLYVEHVLAGAEGTYGTFGVVLGLLSWMYLLSRWIVLAAEVDVVRVRGLWPRSLFQRSATSGDERSEEAQAREGALSDKMDVEVTYGEGDAATGGTAAGGAAVGSAATPPVASAGGRVPSSP